MKPLRHPIQDLSRAKRSVLFGVTFLVGFVLWYALQQLDVPLETHEARWGIVSLELSGTVEGSQEIIDSWKGTAVLDNAHSGLLLDFIFPLCYSTVLTIACFWAASLFRERGFRKTAWLATAIAWLQWPAALCDYVENIATLGADSRSRPGSVARNWPRFGDDQIHADCPGAVLDRRRRRDFGASSSRTADVAAPTGPAAAESAVLSKPNVDAGIRPVP